MPKTVLVVLLSALLSTVTALSAQEANPDEGGALFRTYCATCHGIEGRGSGPMAEMMVVDPPDLTQLAAGNDGTFPVLWVARRIDGRDLVPAHGGPMPLFGSFFEGSDLPLKLPTGQPMMVSQPLADLLAWLESIQE